MTQDSKPPTPPALASVSGYVAVVRTWPQTGPDSFDLEIVTKVLTGTETISDVMNWCASNYGSRLNVTITKAT